MFNLLFSGWVTTQNCTRFSSFTSSDLNMICSMVNIFVPLVYTCNCTGVQAKTKTHSQDRETVTPTPLGSDFLLDLNSHK